MPSTEADGARTVTRVTSDADVPEQVVPAELSLGEALPLAVQLHRTGQLEAAETIYRRILAIEPEQADALNFLGMISMHRGRLDEAIDSIRRSIASEPGLGERYNNLGNVLLAAERIDDAVAAYEQAIALAPAHAAAYNNLGVIYRAQGRFDEAERAYLRVIELEPKHAEAYNNYGNLFTARGQLHEAMKCHAKALTLRPHDKDAKSFLAIAFATLGDLESTAGIYRAWLEEEPDNPAIKHLLAACSGEGVPARASDQYVEAVFDSFSKTFDAKLAHLNYRAPQLVAGAVGSAAGEPAKRLRVLDAGCGTGLCGPLLVAYASVLEGVDLSGGMLDKARSRGVYDELFKAELTQFLQSHERTYDLVVSADTLCYFGALADAMNATWRALRPSGLLVFTVEKADEATTPEGHRINPHGRYSHTRSYVERLLADAGFADTVLKEDVLRLESAAPVHGYVVTARKAHLEGSD